MIFFSCRYPIAAINSQIYALATDSENLLFVYFLITLVKVPHEQYSRIRNNFFSF